MKSKANVIRVPACIDKGQLAAATAHYGQSNAIRFLDHASATLWLESFVGRYDVVRRQFVGHYVFGVRPHPAPSAYGQPGFVTLPGLDLPTDVTESTDKKRKAKQPAQAAEEVVNDG